VFLQEHFALTSTVLTGMTAELHALASIGLGLVFASKWFLQEHFAHFNL